MDQRKSDQTLTEETPVPKAPNDQRRAWLIYVGSSENGFADVTAGRGNDIGNFDGGGGGIFRGGFGNDYAIFELQPAPNHRSVVGS